MGGMSSVSIDADTLRQLVADAQRGSRLAADRLVRQHEGWVRSAIYGVTGRADVVEDVAQQVWARAWQKLRTLDNPRRLRPWLYSIARNAAIDASMARRRDAEAALSLDGRRALPDARQPSPFGAAAGNELHETLLRAVQALPGHYREPFVLRHLEDWSYAEIGEALELPVETVETRLTRARRMLRELLQDKVAS